MIDFAVAFNFVADEEDRESASEAIGGSREAKDRGAVLAGEFKEQVIRVHPAFDRVGRCGGRCSDGHHIHLLFEYQWN